MRIAVSAEQGTGLDSRVSGHFGRCPCFVIVEVEDSSPAAVKVVENPFLGQHRPGQVPAFIQEQGADVLITGGMGGRAVGFFQQYGIEPVTGAAGTVEEAVRAYLAGELIGAAPCRESIEHGHGHGHGGGEHHGQGPGRRGGGGGGRRRKDS
ncbi:MAG: NifB/NifX family molybdenum-iron cluster-binding protein [bacterium]